MGIDDKLRNKNRRTVRYFLTDHLGSTEALTDSSGKIVSSTNYDSFGNATSNIQTSYRYTGREYDADTGLYYYRNRWYDPEIGLFISDDPIGFAGGDINLYGYVGNNPLSFVDPFGHFPDCPLGFGGFGGSGRFNGEPSLGWLDAVQGALDVAGLAPGAGILADLLNAGISYTRGNYGDAAFSMAAAVPVLGTAAGAGKVFSRFRNLKNVVPSKAYHYTDEATAVLAAKSQLGLPGRTTYLTPEGKLSPIQAQIELALPQKNTAQAVFEVNMKALNPLKISNIRRVTGNVMNRGGGGTEILYEGTIPLDAIKRIK